MNYSRFALCDLQVHTIDDPQQQYGQFQGRERGPDFARRMIAAHRDAGVSVLAVTDHNRIDWYPVLKEHGDALGVFVFPGLEVSVNGCHLLLIWDRTDEGYALAQQFLPTLWAPGVSPFLGNGDPRPVTSGQVLNIAEKAIEHRALVLAPHATMAKMGLLSSRVCSNRNEIVSSGLILGFDVYGNKSADVLKNPRTTFGDIAPRWFISSDSRSFEDVGKRAVYMKLNNPPTLEGIRQAFIAADTRIRFPERLLADWGHAKHIAFLGDPEPKWSRATSLKIPGGFHDGLHVEFGPGLNAIIGGKGTGKSTLIEIMRYVLGAAQPVQQIAKDLHGNRQANFKPNAEATISFVADSGEAYAVTRAGGETPPRLTRNGTDVDASLVQKRTRVRVFGQRELQTYAQDDQLRREFVAWHAGSAWQTAVSAEQLLLSNLAGVEGLIVGLEQQLAQLDALKEQLADLQERLDRAREKSIETLFAESESLERVNLGMMAALEWPNRVEVAARAFAQVLPPPSVPTDTSVSERLAEVVRAVEQSVRASSQLALDELEASRPTLIQARQEWETFAGERRKKVVSELADAGFHNLGELSYDQQQAANIEAQIAALELVQSRLNSQEKTRSGLIAQLQENRRQQSRLIEEAARELTKQVGGRIRVRVEPLCDTSRVLDCLTEATKGQGLRREQLARLAAHSPSTIAAAIRRRDKALQELGCTPTTATVLSGLPSSVAREIERTPVLDIIRIEINVGSSTQDSWIDVDKASPGQRATAMLALALSSGSEPLIIDQPEDDLDNRYIYEEVVKIIAQVCTRRQVIVATHNANVPVLGDAEMILALDAAADRSKVLAVGGLEDPKVAFQVRHILEGGDEAFRARQSRYESTP